MGFKSPAGVTSHYVKEGQTLYHRLWRYVIHFFFNKNQIFSVEARCSKIFATTTTLCQIYHIRHLQVNSGCKSFFNLSLNIFFAGFVLFVKGAQIGKFVGLMKTCPPTQLFIVMCCQHSIF